MADGPLVDVSAIDSAVEAYPELLSASQMQAVDLRAVQQGMDSFELMKCAASGVCKHVCDVLKKAEPVNRHVVIVAGPGNNGGDGLVAGSLLRNLGYEVSMLSVGKPPVDDIDASKALALWGAPVLDIDDAAAAEKISRASVIVDAMFGAGLTRTLDGRLAKLVEIINTASGHIVAVDVPSGLDGDTHLPYVPCIRAHSTVTFFRFKPAHFLYPGRDYCGQLFLAQIGLNDKQLPADSESCQLNMPRVFTRLLPSIEPTAHKFTRGHVLVRGGPVSATGASRLSACTALYSGAGLVTLASTTDALPVNAAHLTAVMLSVCNSASEWQALLADHRINTVVIGPANGVDESTRQAVRLALKTERCCVLDADALSCWNAHEDSLITLLAEASAEVVLTPHAGEFTRVFGHTDIVQLPSKLHQARAAAKLSSSTVIFKGADTVIAAADGRACININAPAWLATAGAGDVLAGLVAALIAQGMPAFEASCAAVWLHGSAAKTLGYPLCAEQLVEAVGRELNALVKARVVENQTHS